MDIVCQVSITDIGRRDNSLVDVEMTAIELHVNAT